MVSPPVIGVQPVEAFYTIDGCFGSGVQRNYEGHAPLRDRKYAHHALGIDAHTGECYVSTILPRQFRVTQGGLIQADAYEEQFSAHRGRAALTAVISPDCSAVNVFRSTVSLTPYDADIRHTMVGLGSFRRAAASVTGEKDVVHALIKIANRAGESALCWYSADAVGFAKHEKTGEYQVKPLCVDASSGFRWVRPHVRPDPWVWVNQEQLRRALAGEALLTERFLTTVSRGLRR